MAVVILARTAWPYQQLRGLTVACAIGFLGLMAVALYGVWKIHADRVREGRRRRPDTDRETLNGTMRAYLWANVGLVLLALTVFQFSPLVK